MTVLEMLAREVSLVQSESVRKDEGGEKETR